MKKSAQAIPNPRLRRAREQRNWSQEQLAAALGVTAKTVSRWERGESRPTPHFREQLCRVFELGAGDLGLLPDGHAQPSPPSLAPHLASQRTGGLYDPAIPLALFASNGLVGRDALLARLKERLNDGSSIALSALGGLPGVGKTTLAVFLARDTEVRAHFADGVLWAGLGPQPDVPGHLARWGRLLGVSLEGAAKNDGGRAWAQALQMASGERRMLLVIDDAWRVEEAQILKLGGPNCAYLLTTRFPAIASLFAREEVTVVEELPEEDGLALLSHLAPRAVQADPDGALALVRAVGGLPLALTLMGHYLRVEALGGQLRRIGGALARLSDAAARLALTQPQVGLERHPSLEAGAALSLRAVIGVSVERLDGEARGALVALSALPAKPNTFSEEAGCAVAGCGPQALGRLGDAGLLESGGAPACYTLHPVIADFLKSLAVVSYPT